MNEQPPTAVDPFGCQAQIMPNRHRRLAGGRDAVDVGGPEPGIGHRVERSAGMQLDLRHVGNDAEPGRLGRELEDSCFLRTYQRCRD